MKFNDEKQTIEITSSQADELLKTLDDNTNLTSKRRRNAGYSEKPLLVVDGLITNAKNNEGQISLSANEDETEIVTHGIWKMITLSRKDLLSLRADLKLSLNEVKIKLIKAANKQVITEKDKTPVIA